CCVYISLRCITYANSTCQVRIREGLVSLCRSKFILSILQFLIRFVQSIRCVVVCILCRRQRVFSFLKLPLCICYSLPRVDLGLCSSYSSFGFGHTRFRVC